MKQLLNHPPVKAVSFGLYHNITYTNTNVISITDLLFLFSKIKKYAEELAVL